VLRVFAATSATVPACAARSSARCRGGGQRHWLPGAGAVLRNNGTAVSGENDLAGHGFVAWTADRSAHTLAEACCVELQEVSPAPLRTVSGRASRCLQAGDVLAGVDRVDAFSPGSSGGGAPGEGVRDPQQWVAVRWQVVVAEAGVAVVAQLVDQHLTVEVVAALAGLDDQPCDAALE
jgi:hypothetical protein